MELHQQHGLFGQAQFGVVVHHAHRVRIDQFHAGNRDAHLDDLNRGAHRRFDAGEGAGGRRHRFRQWVELQRDFGDHAQGAFAAHHQTRQVVTRRGLAGAGAGANHFTAGGDDFQTQHVFTHGAVAHRVRAAGAGRAHAANAGVCTGVDREKQARAFDFFVELFARDAGLHGHGQVFSVDGQHLVHAGHVDADAALHRQQMAFQRRADTKGNHRHIVRCGQGHRFRYIGRAFSKHHRCGRGHRGVGGLVTAMLFAHHQGGGTALTKVLLQSVQQGLRHLALGDGGHQVLGGAGCVHGKSPRRRILGTKFNITGS